MRHPTDGTLRRLLDEPAGVADADREHVAGCSGVPVRAGRRPGGRRGSPARPSTSSSRVDVDAAWQRLSHAVAAGGRAAGACGHAARSLAGGAAQPGGRRRSASSPC